MQPPLAAVSIQGTPVLGDRLLTPSSVQLQNLHTEVDCAALATQIRGQFSIIIRTPDLTTAITDFTGSHPIYFIRTSENWRLSHKLADLVPFTSNSISRSAVHFFAARGSLGADPLYAGVQQVRPASVTRFSAESFEQRPYLDWCEMAAEAPCSDDDAITRFIELATSSLLPVVSGEPAVGCLLSGGTDSAIAAWLLKQICPRVVCFTADYAFGRYSEYDAAHTTAQVLGLEHKRILVTRSDHWSMLAAFNAADSDRPISHGQLTSLGKISEAAAEMGIRIIVNGDNADTLFMGLGGFFSGLPEDLAQFKQRTAELNTDEKLNRIVNWGSLDSRGASILAALGLPEAPCRDWMKNRDSEDRALFRPFAERFPLWRFQQIAGQCWGGVPYQSCWLPAERHVDGIHYVSPYLDLQSVKFGLSLPIEHKYRKGVKKFLLHNLLETKTGIRIQKRASPNPSRIWTLLPDVTLPSKMDPRLVAPFLSASLRNIAQKGSNYGTVTNIAALGMWLKSHQLEELEAA